MHEMDGNVLAPLGTHVAALSQLLQGRGIQGEYMTINSSSADEVPATDAAILPYHNQPYRNAEGKIERLANNGPPLQD